MVPSVGASVVIGACEAVVSGAVVVPSVCVSGEGVVTSAVTSVVSGSEAVVSGAGVVPSVRASVVEVARVVDGTSEAVVSVVLTVGASVSGLGVVVGDVPSVGD